MPRPKSNAEEILAGSEAYVGPQEAAAMLGVSPSTVKKMIDSGTLRAWRTEGGHRRISATSVQAAARSVKRMAASGAPHGKLAVLIVEDNPTTLKAFSRLFGTWGERLDLQFAGDAAEALLAIAQRRPDVVITDLAMKPFDGFHLIKMVRGSPELRATRMVVVSGLSGEEIEARGGLDPAVVHYHKPLSNERLAGYIDAQLQMRRIGE
jgi:excisionase family DNA binding protein